MVTARPSALRFPCFGPLAARTVALCSFVVSLRHCPHEGWYGSVLLLRTGFEPSTTQAAHTTILNWLEADGLEEAAAFFSHRPKRPNLASPRIFNQGDLMTL